MTTEVLSGTWGSVMEPQINGAYSVTIAGNDILEFVLRYSDESPYRKGELFILSGGCIDRCVRNDEFVYVHMGVEEQDVYIQIPLALGNSEAVYLTKKPYDHGVISINNSLVLFLVLVSNVNDDIDADEPEEFILAKTSVDPRCKVQ